MTAEPLDLDVVEQVWEHARAAAAGGLKPSECDTCAAAIDAMPALVAEVKQLRGGPVGEMVTAELEALRRQRDAALDRGNAAVAAVERVRALHGTSSPGGTNYCPHCGGPGMGWPCPTIRALDPETAGQQSGPGQPGKSAGQDGGLAGRPGAHCPAPPAAAERPEDGQR